MVDMYRSALGGQSSVPSRQHGRRVIPIVAVVFAVTLIIPVGVLGLVSTARAGAPAGPDIICCGQFFTNVTVWPNFTNVTINFTAAFDPTTGPSVDFGNTTAGEVFNQSFTSYNPSTGEGKFFIDFLEPSGYEFGSSTETYNFTLVADGGGRCNHNSIQYYCWYDGNFSTLPWEGSSQVSGFVSLVGGGNAPSGTVVEVNCSVGGGSLVQFDTNSNGAYSADISNWLEDDCFATPFQVTAVAPAGYWSETAVVWAPQVVSFVLPQNYTQNYTVSYIDFSNAPANYTNLGIETGTGYEDSYSYSTSAGGSAGAIGAGISEATTSSTGVGVTEGTGSTNGNYCWAEKSWVTGAAAFSAISRAWSFQFAPTSIVSTGQFCDQLPGFHQPTSWMYPGSPWLSNGSIYYLLGPNGTQLKNAYVLPGNYIDYSTTVSNTVSSTSSIGVSFAVSGTIIDALPLSAQVVTSWSQTVSTSSSQTLSWDLEPPNGGESSCFDVFGEGGSQPLNTADMVGVYWWAAPPNGICSGG